MGFTGGIIVAVGILVAAILGMIAIDPGYLSEPPVEPVEEKPTACTMEWRPVCGVDGTTYGNECMLDAEGVELAHTGECVEEPVYEKDIIPDVEITLEPEPEPKPVTSAVPAIPFMATVGVAEGSSVLGCEETNDCYTPYQVMILLGGTVTWSNDDTAAHTVTSGTPEGGPDGLFDSSLFMSGNTFEFTFDEEGEYDYFCMVHPWMTGKVVVQDVEEMVVENQPQEEPTDMEAPPPSEPEPLPEPEPEPEELTLSVAVSLPEGSAVRGCEETNTCYIPHEVTISTGGKVIWSNDDTAAHTVTSGMPGTPDGLFDSSLFMSGNTFEFTFDEAGEYDYYCMVHPWMVGKVIVS